MVSKLRLGSALVDNLRLGASQVAKAYLGTNLLFSAAAPELSIFGDTVFADGTGGGAYTLGVEFYVTAPAKVKAIKYTQRTGVAGTKTVALYSMASPEAPLVTAASAEGASNGWVRVDVAETTLTPDQHYIAAVHYPNGYPFKPAGWPDHRINGILFAPRWFSALAGGQGQAKTGASLAYPTDLYNNDYGVDVVVQPT